MSETKRLGRGLEALLGPVSREAAEESGALRELPLSSLRPNPYQPRTRLDETALGRAHGFDGSVGPVAAGHRPAARTMGTRSSPASVAGGRPSDSAGSKISAVVRDVDDQTLLTLALIENLQRDDLSPIDEARGYRRLGDEFRLPQSEIARTVGRNRSTVANLLRLLQLPEEIQAMVHQRRSLRRACPSPARPRRPGADALSRAGSRRATDGRSVKWRRRSPDRRTGR